MWKVPAVNKHSAATAAVLIWIQIDMFVTNHTQILEGVCVGELHAIIWKRITRLWLPKKGSEKELYSLHLFGWTCSCFVEQHKVSTCWTCASQRPFPASQTGDSTASLKVRMIASLADWGAVGYRLPKSNPWCQTRSASDVWNE